MVRGFEPPDIPNDLPFTDAAFTRDTLFILAWRDHAPSEIIQVDARSLTPVAVYTSPVLEQPKLFRVQEDAKAYIFHTYDSRREGVVQLEGRLSTFRYIKQ